MTTTKEKLKTYGILLLIVVIVIILAITGNNHYQNNLRIAENSTTEDSLRFRILSLKSEIANDSVVITKLTTQMNEQIAKNKYIDSLLTINKKNYEKDTKNVFTLSPDGTVSLLSRYISEETGNK